MRNFGIASFRMRNQLLNGVRNRIAQFQPQPENTTQANNRINNNGTQPQVAALVHPAIPRPTALRNIPQELQTGHNPVMGGGIFNRSPFAASRLFTNWHSPGIYSYPVVQPPRAEAPAAQAPVLTPAPTPAQISMPTFTRLFIPRAVVPAQTHLPMNVPPRQTALIRFQAQPAPLLTPAQIVAKRRQELERNQAVQEQLINIPEETETRNPPPVAAKSEKVLRFIRNIRAQAPQNQAHQNQTEPDLAAIRVVEDTLDSVLEGIEEAMKEEEAAAVEAMLEAYYEFGSDDYFPRREADSTCSDSVNSRRNPLLELSFKTPKKPV